MTIIDISEYQPKIDWNVLRAHCAGVIIRAGQNTWEDNLARQHIANAVSAGMPYSLYHFYQPNKPPTDQVNFIVNFYNSLTVKPAVLWVDVENISYTGVNVFPPSKEAHSVWLSQWLHDVKEKTGCKTGVYTRQNYWDPWVVRSGSVIEYNGTKYTMPDWSQYELWIAAWTMYTSKPILPKDWSTWNMWQYQGGTGRITGVEGPCDLNRYNGDESNIPEYFGNGATYVPEEPPTPDELTSRVSMLEEEVEIIRDALRDVADRLGSL